VLGDRDVTSLAGGTEEREANTTLVLEARGLVRQFNRRVRFGVSESILAVDHVDLVVRGGDVLGIVGASGSGKSTLARMLTCLLPPSAGQVILNGRDVYTLDKETVRREVRPAIRMIFQDPDAALNPAYPIGEGLRRALMLGGRVSSEHIDESISKLLAEVGLPSSYAFKYPDELSGGEKRRLGICRALSSDPVVIVADEPLSGLDVVLQERVLALFLHEQTVRQFALVLVSHDLDRVHQVCNRVAVMFAGRVVESAPVVAPQLAPEFRYRHPYAIELAAAKDRLHYGLQGRSADHRHTSEFAATREFGTPTGTTSRMKGCAYRGACPRYVRLGRPSHCAEAVPELTEQAPHRSVACHFSEAD